MSSPLLQVMFPQGEVERKLLLVYSLLPEASLVSSDHRREPSYSYHQMPRRASTLDFCNLKHRTATIVFLTHREFFHNYILSSLLELYLPLKKKK